MVWREPFKDFMKMARDFDKFFDFSDMKGFREPLSDMWETEDAFMIHIELPGVNKEDIKLNITERDLEVKVEKKEEVSTEEEGFKRMERSYRGFYRRFTLPEEVDKEKIDASYENGILKIKLPKTEKSKKKEKIEIK